MVCHNKMYFLSKMTNTCDNKVKPCTVITPIFKHLKMFGTDFSYSIPVQREIKALGLGI